MAIQNGDTILIQRGNNSYKVNAIDYADIAQDGDFILVDRGGSSYKMRYDAVDNASNSDLILVDRGGSSYKATMSQFRDVLGQPITFYVEIAGRGQNGQDSFGCNSINYYTRYGSKIAANVTAKTTDFFSFSGSPGNGVQGSSATGFYINDDWIMIAGNCGSFGVSYYAAASPPCNAIDPSTNGQGLAPVGQKRVQSQQNNIYTVYGPYFAILQGGGGAGCPGGTTGGNAGGGTGGFCQTRPRGENSGSTWNDISVTNISVTSGSSYNSSYKITYNGVTKTFEGGNAGSAKLKDLLSW